MISFYRYYSIYLNNLYYLSCDWSCDFKPVVLNLGVGMLKQKKKQKILLQNIAKQKKNISATKYMHMFSQL